MTSVVIDNAVQDLNLPKCGNLYIVLGLPPETKALLCGSQNHHKKLPHMSSLRSDLTAANFGQIYIFRKTTRLRSQEYHILVSHKFEFCIGFVMIENLISNLTYAEDCVKVL